MHHRSGTKRHHSGREDSGMSHDRDPKRRKVSRGPHDPYSPQSAGPPHHSYGPPPPGQGGVPIGQGGPPPPGHGYHSHGPPQGSNAPPPYPQHGPLPQASSRGGYTSSMPQFSNYMSDRAYMSSRRTMPKDGSRGMPLGAHGPPNSSQPPPRGVYGGPSAQDHGGPPPHNASPYGAHHLQSPMSPSGSKRKPSIFHTPSQKSHGPPTPMGGPSTKQISPSGSISGKKGSLQTRRDVQLNKLSVKASPAKSHEPEYGPRKPTKMELLKAIEKYDHDITRLTKELGASRQSTVSDSVVVDEEKYLQDPEIKRKPQMHQMFFSNFVKSIESHSKFDCVKYFPKNESDPEFPLTDESFWNHLYEQHRESHTTIADQVTEVIRQNVESEMAWVRNMKTTFAVAQKKWLKANNVKPPPKDWLQLAAVPPSMKTKAQREFVFIDDNGFAEDPLLEDQDYYNKSAELSRWNDYEVEIFKQKYHIYPKNFRKISEFLPNKTVGDCINFYYHNKKDPILKHVIDEVKAKGSFQAAWAEVPANGTGGKPSILNADGHHVDERSRPPSEDEMEDSGDEQYVFKPSTRGRPKRKKGSAKENAELEWTDAERAQFVEMYEAFPKDWKRIALSLQTKSVSQCKTFFAANKQDLGLGKSRRQRGGRRSTRSNAKEEKKPAATGKSRATGGKRKKATKRPVSYWTKSEKADFLVYLQKFGKDWKVISNHLETKTENQVLKQFQALKKILGLSVSDDEEEETKKKNKKRARSNQGHDLEEATSPLPPDNDLRFFAEIASIKGSIDMNSDTSIEEEKEEQTYSTTTLLHSWIAKKYLSGVVPMDQRPMGLEVLAHESERRHEEESSLPDDIKPLVSRDNDALTTSRIPGSQYGTLIENDGLGYFWGDGLLSGEGSDDEDFVPSSMQHRPVAATTTQVGPAGIAVHQ